MITLIVPTRNGAAALARVAPTFFSQDDVDEIIFVDDAGDDDSAEVLSGIASRHPQVRWRLLRNTQRLGIARSRNLGAQASRNQFLLFCGDDEYLGPGYARTCLDKLVHYGAAAVSGRHLEMREGESPAQALRRFGHGLHEGPTFRPLRCESDDAARFVGDLRVPVTHAVILTRVDLLLRHPFDPFYGPGQGRCEDADYQLNLFVHGHDIWVTNDCHCLRLPPRDRLDGAFCSPPRQRASTQMHALQHLYGKYYDAYARRLHLRLPRPLALLASALLGIHDELLRPRLHRLAAALRSRRARWRHAASQLN